MTNQSVIDLRESTEILQIVQARPPVIVRGAMGLFLLLVVFAVVWAGFTEVDQIARATGAVRSEGESLRVQIARAGMVREVRFKEGDRVLKGQILLLLDDEPTVMEISKIQDAIASTKNDIERLSRAQLAHDLEMTKRERQAELDLEVAQASLEREKQVELERHRDHQLQMKLAASAYDAAIKDQERFRELFRAGIISRRQLEEAEKREREARLQHENAGMRARDDGTAVELAQARVRAAEQSLQVLIAKGESEKQDLEAELAAGNARLRQMKLDLDRLRYDLQLCQVLSPVAGTITHAELQSSSVVAAGDLAATIAPAGILKFEGLVPNSEIAEIRVGQEVRIKLDAFPFQEHGTVPGEIAFVAPDAVNSGESGRTGYEIHVRLIGDHFGTDPLNPIELELGMAGTAEIVRERRTLLYLVAQSIFRQQNSESHG